MTIELSNVSFRYEREKILDAVSLFVNRGEFIGIFGPNGGGKTTFLKLLLGFLKPQTGKVKVSGKRMGYVPQAAAFDRQFPISALEVVLMGCLEDLSFFGYFSSETKERAREALSKVGLLSMQHLPFGALSGGQAQRVLIARALVNHPDILLLDEPTASIDMEAEQQIFKLLDELKRSITILMVSHDLASVIKRADRLICIRKQATIFSPGEVCEHFALGLYHK